MLDCIFILKKIYDRHTHVVVNCTCEFEIPPHKICRVKFDLALHKNGI